MSVKTTKRTVCLKNVEKARQKEKRKAKWERCREVYKNGETTYSDFLHDDDDDDDHILLYNLYYSTVASPSALPHFFFIF